MFKGEKYLKYSLPSLIKQDYSNIEYLFRDQSPNGETYEYIKKEMPEILKKVTIEKGGNLWHSGGHNSLIRKMNGSYYICCSNDMLYPNDFVSRMVEVMEKPDNKKISSATCKLMQWNFEEVENNNFKASKTMIIDSCGIGITKGNSFFDIGQGETNHTLYSTQKEVFGTSAALGIYKKEALDDIAFKNNKGEKEYFDELLHYKNDVDLAYRLRWAGHKCLFIPNVKVYHDRQVSGSGNILYKAIKHRKESKWAKGNSLFGHIIVLKKNMGKNFSMTVRFKTYLNGIIRYFHTLIFDYDLLEQYKLVEKFRSEINNKKKSIIKRVSTKEIEKFMI